MGIIVSLYSDKHSEIKKFLTSFYNNEICIENDLKWEYCFKNPIESADIIGVFIENNDRFKINMWVSLDDGFFVNITEHNADKIIRYLFERYPY